MYSRFILARRAAKNKVEEPIKEEVVQTTQSKIVYAYLNDKLVGEYDSITKCAQLLGLSRAMVKKAIDSQTVLDNGFLLTFKK